MKKKWEFYKPDEELVNKISEKHNIPTILASALVNRGIIDDDEIKIFLEPTRADFHDPYEMPDMQPAIDRIIKAIESKEKVIIYGDYDVDGITSITVLKKFLQERGLETGYYIPNRLSEGYGLNKDAIKKIADEGYSLIITVDCGISGIDDIKYAYELGMEVIVTDHHEPLDELPKAVAVIDCKRKDNKYPFNGLCGAGVAFKICQAIAQRLNLEEKTYLKYLDIVCVGTISDIVPLVDENRVIAKLGLKLAGVTKNLGLRALINTTGYKEVNSNTVSFGIAPRINACGRMGHENEALNLFFNNDLNEVQKITESLNSYNRERQEIEKTIYNEALEKIKKEKIEKNDVMVVASNDWHHGVIGIVSSKITDLYFKPSILIGIEGEMGKGSGRSIPGFDLHDALCKCSDLLDKYGGHEMAVGLSLPEKNIPEFSKRLNELAKDKHTSEITPVLIADSEITSKDLNKETIEALKKLEPFGEANKMPSYIYKNLKIDSIRALSEGKHIKLTLKDGNTIINAIGFNLGSMSEEFQIGDKVDVFGVLEINSFNGEETIQINLKDIRRSY